MDCIQVIHCEATNSHQVDFRFESRPPRKVFTCITIVKKTN
jgi:hypothetical protein